MVLVDVSGEITAVSKLNKGITASGHEWRRVTFLMRTMDQNPTTLEVSVDGDHLDEFGHLIEKGKQVIKKASLYSRSWRYNGEERWTNNIDLVYAAEYEENPSGESKMTGIVAGVAAGMKAK